MRGRFLVALLGAAVIGCQTADSVEAPLPTVSSVTIAPYASGALPGHQAQFTVSARNDDGSVSIPTTGNNRPVWSTSNPAIASIDQRGVVTANVAGEVLVSVSFAGRTATAGFESLVPVATAAMAMPTQRLIVPASIRVAAVLRDAAGDSLTTDFRDLTWASSDTTVARAAAWQAPGQFSQDGRITLTGFGTATITLTAVAEHVSASAVITTSPLQYRVMRVGANEYFSGLECALDVDGHPYCWANPNPTLTIPGQWYAAPPDSAEAVPMPINTELTFDSLVVSVDHACGLTHDGTAWCWGANASGQAGDGLVNYEWLTTPVPVSGGFHFASLTAAQLRTCGAVIGGGSYCWGYNSTRDELGTGHPDTAVYAPVPAVLGPVPAPSGVTLATIRMDPASHNGGASCGMTVDTIAVCWSVNTLGAAGIGGVSAFPIPPTPVASPERLVSIVPGGEHTCGLTALGAAYCWGNAQGGVLGVPSELRGYPTPLPIASPVQFTSIDAALYHTCGIALDHTVWCWGQGWGLTPVQVTLPDPVNDMHASTFMDCAVTTRHQAWCWTGANHQPVKQFGN